MGGWEAQALQYILWLVGAKLPAIAFITSVY